VAAIEVPQLAFNVIREGRLFSMQPESTDHLMGQVCYAAKERSIGGVSLEPEEKRPIAVLFRTATLIQPAGPKQRVNTYKFVDALKDFGTALLDLAIRK